MKNISIIIGVIIVLAAVAWFFFIKSNAIPGLNNNGEDSPGATAEQSSGLGGALFNAVKQNPTGGIPDTNPFQNNLNPYKSGYTNPF
ncbi:MAG: hypothetical protein Q7S78_00705 [Candidatus Azambacteria bacterium]|nr:hypothetical protein [Candidatus Azambacteria bacterium]